MSETIDYKDTLQLPNTSFPMRGSLPNNEPKAYKLWDETKVYEENESKQSGL